ncbi:LuxR C-terminal-related transcriptional regulator [Paeniglutamicibacter gangotriensis]|uniref:helix-turn-helix transcriptional regulator n=1 Tax=Paeniglutamicibacter gangotriensis TaxID=254787 RepID=UPI0037CB4167
MDHPQSLALLARLLLLAEGGAAQLVLVRGPAGCGKSTLARRFMDANKHLAAWTSAGTRWEKDLPGSALQEMLDTAETPNGSPLPERLLSFMRGAGRIPGIVLVENLQWADTDSLEALLYAWRRLRHEKVLLMMTLRREESSFLPQGTGELVEAPNGTIIDLDPPGPTALKDFASARLGIELSTAAAYQLSSFTAGNLHTALDLIRENPAESWNHFTHRFPVPRAVTAATEAKLGSLSAPARSLLEAAAVLSPGPRLDVVVSLTGAQDPLPLIEECVASGLVTVAGNGGNLALVFPSSIEHMAVYHLIPLSRRLALHAAAAAICTNDGESLAHRADATLLTDPGLSQQLELYAAKQAGKGEWASAATALHRAAGLSTNAAQREPLFLRAVDATVAAGELPSALVWSDELASLPESPQRALLSGYIAILQGRANTADRWLSSAWTGAAHSQQHDLMAIVSQRRVLDSLCRLDGGGLVDWAETTRELANEESTVSVEASAIQGLGLGMLGKVREGEEMLTTMLASLATGAQRQRSEMALGWLHVAGDQIELARHELSSASSTDFSEGSHRIALWARAWLARAEFAAGDWDQALETVRSAVILQERSGIDLMRPLLHHTAVLIHSMRGEHQEVDSHLAKAWARTGSYAIMQVPYRMARAAAAHTRSDYDEVILALEPLLAFDRTAGIDEPGFWPWQDTYADALVRKNRLEEAEEFLAPFEAMARKRQHRSATARALAVRGNILAARGELDAAKNAFEEALTLIQGITLPVLRAHLEYGYGQSLRRSGKRGDAVGPLTRALAGFTQFNAVVYIDRCNRELQATGISVPRRDTADWSSLTSQEKAVASLVCAGASNKKAAEELFIGAKTVQYHLTRIYAKLRVTSRTELAARYRDNEH